MVLLFEKYELKDDTTLMNDIANTILELSWFDNLGTASQETEEKVTQVMNDLNVSSFQFKWISKDELANQLDNVSLEDSPLWEKLKDIPSIYNEKIQQNEMGKLWKILVDELPEHLFHEVFEKAYEQYEDEEIVRYLINHAMYVSILISLAKLAGEKQFADTLVNLINTGNIVAGFNGEELYL